MSDTREKIAPNLRDEDTMNTSTETSTPSTDTPAWVTLAAGAGIILYAAWWLTDEPKPLAYLAMTALAVAIVGWIGHRISGGGQQPAPAAPAGLAGSRISVGGGTVFTVLDDSAAVNAAGRRASVIARDASGAVGLLFIGCDAAGAVVEAKVDAGGDWAPAVVVVA